MINEPFARCASSWPEAQQLTRRVASDSLIVAQHNVGRFPFEQMEMQCTSHVARRPTLVRGDCRAATFLAEARETV